MKEYDLEINNDNVKYSIEHDTLNRNKKINKLIELLNSLKGNKIISIDGKWGCGKTFFLKQLEYINKNELKLNSDFNEEYIKMFREKYFVYYYNAWENDMHESPLLSLIYNLINDFPEEKSQTASGKIEHPFDIVEGLKTVTKNFINLEKVKSYQDLIKEIHTTEEKKNALNNIINNIIPDNKKLIFIVDELDRCKPDYAVNTIEVIKHFYSNEKTIFLLGTNNLQLSHTISNYYGSNFDGYRYLNKIYNFVIELGDVPAKEYIKTIIKRKQQCDFCDIGLYAVCEYFNFSMREINRLLNDYDILYEYMNTSYGGYLAEDMTLKYLFLPYCLGLKISSGQELRNFFEGKGLPSLKKFVFSSEELQKILKKCYQSQNIEKEQSKEELLGKMDQYLGKKYNEYFLNKVDEWKTEKNKTKFFDIFSLLSNYSNCSFEE